MAFLLRPLQGLTGLDKFMSEKWLENFDLKTIQGRRETLRTKREWGSDWVAAEGWYYTGHGNYVQCISCGGQLEMPCGEEILRDYHCVFFPWCDLLNNRVCLQDKLENLEITDKVWNSARHVIEYPLAQPVEPCMKKEELRYYTLLKPDARVTSRAWAKMGLYAPSGMNELRCYYCDVKLTKLDLSKNALMAHVRRSPECEHLKRLLGYVTMGEIRDYYGIVSEQSFDVTDQVPRQALVRSNGVRL